MRDPEMCLELGFAAGPHLNAFYYRNDYVGVEQWSRTIVRDNYVYLASSDFRAMWQENDVSYSGHAVKDLRHPLLGTMSFEVSSFGVDGRQDLTMIVFLPANEDLANRITNLLAEPGD